MTKIAVYLLDAVVAGTTTLAFELADGLRSAGHDVVTLTSTRSGKQTVRWTRPDGGARWWTRGPDITVRHDELVRTLDEFDLVFVNDVASSTLDNKNDPMSLPGYAVGLLETRTPWYPIAHGNAYDERHAPHFSILVEKSRAFGGSILGCPAPYAYDDHELFRSMRSVPLKRPYWLRRAVQSPVPRHWTAGSCGRFSTGKNLHLVGLTMPYLPRPVHLELWGASQSSIRPTDAYLTYELLTGSSDVEIVEECVLKNRTSPWFVRCTNGSTLRYGGAYVDQLAPLTRLRVFVNVTSARFSAGTEYTTLEAIDAGCLPLVTRPMIDPDSDIEFGRLSPIDVPTQPRPTSRKTDVLENLAERIRQSVDVDESVHRTIAYHNREAIRREHDPTTIARRLLDELR